MHPILSITITRLKEFTRRPEALFWVYFFPVLMIIVLGNAFQNQTVETFHVDVIENEHSTDLIEGLSDQSRLEVHLVDTEESSRRLRSGKSVLAIIANDNLNDQKQYVYRIDVKRPGAAAALNIVDDALQKAKGRVDAFTAQETPFDEPGGTYVDFLVPGLLGIGLMGGGMWGVGFAIVDMRIRKLLKRYMATPMRKSDFLISMILSRLVFMIPQIALTLLVAYWMFDFRIYGNYAAVIFLVVLGAFEFAAVGLMVGSRAQTMETASGLMNFVMLPLYTLCGAFFSYERFPEIFHPIIRWLPLTPIIDSLRAVMSEGEPLLAQWPEIVVMTVWSVIPFGIAMLIFRWRD